MNNNNNEHENFDFCMKYVQDLLIEEQRVKSELAKIQLTKMKLVRLLSDNNYCDEVLKEE